VKIQAFDRHLPDFGYNNYNIFVEVIDPYDPRNGHLPPAEQIYVMGFPVSSFFAAVILTVLIAYIIHVPQTPFKTQYI